MSAVFSQRGASGAVRLFGVGNAAVTQPVRRGLEQKIVFLHSAVRVEGRSTVAAADPDDWAELFGDESFIAMMRALGDEALNDFQASGGLELP